MDSDRKTELLVGLFLIVGMLLLGGIILQFGKVRDLFKGTYALKVSFPDASGIKQGSPVVLGGARIGTVKEQPELNRTFTGVVIPMEIFEGVQIPADAKFSISTSGLMGDAYIDIKPTGEITNEFIPEDYDVIIVGQKAGGLQDLSQTAGRIGDQVSSLITDDLKPAVSELKAVIAKVNNDALAATTIADFKSSIEHLNNTMKRVDEQVLGDDNTKNLKDALADIKDAAASFKSTAGEFETQSKRLGPMFDRLDPALTKVESALTSAEEALKSVKKGADHAANTMETLDERDGLLQALMEDEDLKKDFKDLIYNLRHSGVLFYKDKAANLPDGEDRQAAQPQSSRQSEEDERRSLLKRPLNRTGKTR